MKPTIDTPHRKHGLRDSTSLGRVLYLDYDGVLHHEAVYLSSELGPYIDQTEAPGQRLFEWVNILEAILADHPDVSIILSTTWARIPGFALAVSKLPASLRRRVIGKTLDPTSQGQEQDCDFGFLAIPRGLQILGDAIQRSVEVWIALDDDVALWPPSAVRNLIACDGDVGISCPQTQAKLVDWLSTTAPVDQTPPKS